MNASFLATLMFLSGIGYSSTGHSGAYYSGRQLIEVRIDDSGDDGIDKSIAVVLDRLHAMYHQDFDYVVDSNMIRIDLAPYYEVKEAIHYMQMKGELRILETYPAKEIAKAIVELSIKERSTDLDVLAGLVSDPSINFVEGEEGAIFCTVTSKDDLRLVDSLLSTPQVSALIPEEVQPMWQKLAPSDAENFSLILCRLPATNKAITNRMIEDAYDTYNDQGYPLVTCTLKERYAPLWAEMTKRNVGRSLAITFDGAVISAPIVHSEISGGQFQINMQNYGLGAGRLSELLKTDVLHDEVKVISVKWIDAK